MSIFIVLLFGFQMERRTLACAGFDRLESSFVLRLHHRGYRQAYQQSQYYVSREELQGDVDRAQRGEVVHCELHVFRSHAVGRQHRLELRRACDFGVLREHEAVVDELEVDKLRGGHQQGCVEVNEHAEEQCAAERDDASKGRVAVAAQAH